jgi:hypothetical protein
MSACSSFRSNNVQGVTRVVLHGQLVKAMLESMHSLNVAFDPQMLENSKEDINLEFK